MQRTRVALVARSARALWVALGLMLVPAAVAEASGRPEGATQPLLIPSAGWQGRPIQEPHRHDADRTPAADRPLRGWSAGAVSFGAGFRLPHGSVRVQEVQRRLRRLGYRPGPVDGLFGPLTRSSVAWFQVKHGLPVDGRATLATVRHLRARTGAGSSRGRGSTEVRSSSTAESRGSRPWEAFRQLVGPRSVATDGASAAEEETWGRLAVPAMLALGLLLLGAAAMRRLAEVRSRRTIEPAPSAARAGALGYLLVAAGEGDDARFRAHAAAMESECARHGLTLAGLVLDIESTRLGRRRPGLEAAMKRLIAGEVKFLMVSRFGDPADADVERQRLTQAGRSGRTTWRDMPADEREVSDG